MNHTKCHSINSEEFKEDLSKIIKDILKTVTIKGKISYDKILADDPKEGKNAYINFPKIDNKSINNLYEELYEKHKR